VVERMMFLSLYGGNGDKMKANYNYKAIELDFEDAVRFLNEALRKLRREPEARDNQLELFRALQGAHLQYSRIGRNYGADYGKTIKTLQNTARETRSLVSSMSKPRDVLNCIHSELLGIEKTSSIIEKSNRAS